MKLLTSIVLFIIVLLSVLNGWWYAAAFVGLVFSVYQSTAYFIPLAILIDGYSGSFYTVPVLSLVAIGWFFGFEYLRPRLIDVNDRFRS